MKNSSREQVLKTAFEQHLPEWFALVRRAMPWRVNRTPYRVWVAEIMLQQTRADQAAPYYRRFVRTFPSVRALARASLRDVLKAWEGMGYYARARNMHKTAQHLMNTRGGRFPRTYEELKQLPGIGGYTAAAIGSLAMNLDVAVVDGNVIRVLSRVFGVDEPVDTAAGRRIIQGFAESLLPAGRAAEFNEAMMELGALCCTPRDPHCEKCPLSAVCRACGLGRSTEYPRKRRRKAVPHKVVGAGVIMDRRGRVLIAQRRTQDMLGGLWEFPGGKKEPEETMPECITRELREELGIEVKVGELVTVVHHAYSHFTMELHAHRGRVVKGRPRAIECADCAWVLPDELREYPMGRADQHIVAALLQEDAG